MVAAAAGMTATGVAVAVCAAPLARVAGRAAQDLVDPRPYRSVVLVEKGRSAEEER